MDFLFIFLSLAYAAIAAAWDLSSRRIPDALNLAGVVIAVIAAVLSGTSLLPFAALSVAAFAFAYVLYRLGAWAGGDAKFFTALCMFLFSAAASPLVIIALFLTAALFSLALLLLIGGFSLRHSKPIGKVVPGDLPAVSYYLADGKLIEWSPLNFARMWAAVSTGNQRLLLPPAGQLIASATLARGLTAQEISALKDAGVNELPLRRTIAFAPALAVAFAVMVFGALNWVLAVRLA